MQEAMRRDLWSTTDLPGFRLPDDGHDGKLDHLTAVSHRPPPAALTIAGSDCSGGAGLQADLKTFQHFGIHGLSAVTCVVSETSRVLRAVHPVPPDLVRDQISLLLESFPVAAAKSGMLFSAAVVRAVASIWRRASAPPLVVDPVMIASTGDPLLEPDAIAAYRDDLLPLAAVCTPNLPEAETLLGRSITREDDLADAACELSRMLNTSVLLKGGHLDGPRCIDVLSHRGTIHRFEADRLAVAASHGTGCTLSAAVTAGLAQGMDLPLAAERAKHFLGRALATSYRFTDMPGGPINALNQGILPLEEPA